MANCNGGIGLPSVISTSLVLGAGKSKLIQHFYDSAHYFTEII
jgi:hypothetical protein